MGRLLSPSFFLFAWGRRLGDRWSSTLFLSPSLPPLPFLLARGSLPFSPPSPPLDERLSDGLDAHYPPFFFFFFSHYRGVFPHSSLPFSDQIIFLNMREKACKSSMRFFPSLFFPPPPPPPFCSLIFSLPPASSTRSCRGLGFLLFFPPPFSFFPFSQRRSQYTAINWTRPPPSFFFFSQNPFTLFLPGLNVGDGYLPFLSPPLFVFQTLDLFPCKKIDSKAQAAPHIPPFLTPSCLSFSFPPRPAN